MKTAIVIIVTAAVVVIWFAMRSSVARRGAVTPAAQTPPATNVFADLRAKYFTLTRNESCPVPASTNAPWGAMMEIGYPQAIVTTVAFTDGTASVLRSSGGGFFGGGTIGGVKTAAEDFLTQAQQFQSQTTDTHDFPQPRPGQVAFYLFTDSGRFTWSGNERELSEQSHPFSPFYYAGLRILHEYLQLEKQQSK